MLTAAAQQCGIGRTAGREKSMRIAVLLKLAMFFALGLLLTAAAPQPAKAATAVEIDAEVDAALVRFYEQVPAAKDLAKKAKGICSRRC
jgi:hypothetical protein